MLRHFRSDDGERRYDVEDYEPDAEHRKGDKVDAVAHNPHSFDRGTLARYVEAAKPWSVPVTVFGMAILVLGPVVRPHRPMPRRIHITFVSMFFGGIGSCVRWVLVGLALA